MTLIEAAGLRKTFGDFVAVDSIDLQISAGESFGFLGPNGAGKTSTMRMIGCTSPVGGGTLRVLGMDPTTQAGQIKARLGVVPQQDALDEELTVAQNIAVFGRYFGISRAELRRRSGPLLEVAQLTERAGAKADTLPGGTKGRT